MRPTAALVQAGTRGLRRRDMRRQRDHRLDRGRHQRRGRRELRLAADRMGSAVARRHRRGAGPLRAVRRVHAARVRGDKDRVRFAHATDGAVVCVDARPAAARASTAAAAAFRGGQCAAEASATAPTAAGAVDAEARGQQAVRTASSERRQRRRPRLWNQARRPELAGQLSSCVHIRAHS